VEEVGTVVGEVGLHHVEETVMVVIERRRHPHGCLRFSILVEGYSRSHARVVERASRWL
jgi:hypothetical protein